MSSGQLVSASCSGQPFRDCCTVSGAGGLGLWWPASSMWSPGLSLCDPLWPASVIQALDSFGVSLLPLISEASWSRRTPGPWETCFLSLLRILAQSLPLALLHQVDSLFHCPYIASGEPFKLSCPHDTPLASRFPKTVPKGYTLFSTSKGSCFALGLFFSWVLPSFPPCSFHRASEFFHIGAGCRRVGGFSSLGFCCA